MGRHFYLGALKMPVILTISWATCFNAILKPGIFFLPEYTLTLRRLSYSIMKPTLLIILLFLSFAQLRAQTYFNLSLGNAMIRADSSCPSALISNITTQRGDRSQLLGTGLVPLQDSGMECRSLLAFDLKKISPFLVPELVSRARLVLFPMRMGDGATDQQSFPASISVSRITSPWNDSLTNWNNQPLTDAEHTIVKNIRPAKADDIVEINVTRQLKKMLREGNYGFMISSMPVSGQSDEEIKWYASSRHQVKDFRPVLLIEFSRKPNPAQPIQTGTPFVGIRMEELDQAYRIALIDYNQYRNDVINGLPVDPKNAPPPPVNPGTKD